MHYDVIVVGLGAMGSASLYQLSKQGASVLGIDLYEPPHNMGSTHGETRITRLAIGEGDFYIPFARRSHEIWRELEAASGQRLLTLSGGLIICPKEGGANFHGQGDFASQTAVLAQRHNIDHALWGADAVRERWPLLQMQPHEHAYYEPTGGIVDPERCVEVQLELARRHSKTAVRFNERVLTYKAHAHGVTVTTDQGSYETDKLILAAGAWMPQLLPEVAAKPLQVYRQSIYWFEAVDGAVFHSDRFPFVLWIGDTLADFFTIFPYHDGHSVGAKVLTERYDEGGSADEIRRTITEAEISEMYEQFVMRRVQGVLPTCFKKDVCLYTVTPDQHFILDFHPASERVIVASPCSGHGFKHSAAIGEALAQVALSGGSVLDLSPFRLARFDEAG